MPSIKETYHAVVNALESLENQGHNREDIFMSTLSISIASMRISGVSEEEAAQTLSAFATTAYRNKEVNECFAEIKGGLMN